MNEVNLSQFHAGQICSPVVTEQLIRGSGDTAIIEVKWYWVDASIAHGQPGHQYAHGECRGRVAKCRAALRKAGIRTDDSRSFV